MQTELGFDQIDETSLDAVSPLSWIYRTYQTALEWKSIARGVFISVNGDSDVARNRLAAKVRQFFKETTLNPEEVTRWKKGTHEREVIRVIPPKRSDTNAASVDWLHIADSLLVSGCAVSDEIDQEQQVRESEFQDVERSYRARLVVEEVRKELRQDGSLSDEALTQRLRIRCKGMIKDRKDKETWPPQTSIDEGRKMEKSKVQTPLPIAPVRPKSLPGYVPLYGNE